MTATDDHRSSARPTFAAGWGYNPRYLARKHRISTEQARDLIAEVGHDRERLDRVARAVRATMKG